MSVPFTARSESGLCRIGRYEIEREIGRGANGTVFLAQDPLIGRWVALKTLDEDSSADPEQVAAMRQHLLHEARSAGGLNHPGIVAIHDVIEHEDGRLSIASEYVEGTDLRRRLAEPDPLPLEFVAKVVSAVAAALDYAHSQGVVHRDLKPANILLGGDGSIKVADFGIASLRQRDLADELKNLGSPNYLAPERILGQEATPSSDVYALGVVLFEMLTRNPPFQGESVAELARSVVQDPPPPIDHYRPDVYPEVARLLRRSLEKEPADRFAAAGDLANALNRALEKRSSHNDTVPAPVLEELALSEPPPSSAGPGRGTAEAASVALSPLPRERPSTKRRRGGLFILPIVLGLLVAAIAFVGGRLTSAPAARSGPAEKETAAAARLEYLRLLAESRRLFAEGDRVAAQRLLDRAEELSPAADRIRRMREFAKREAEAERRALVEAEVLDLLDQARAELAEGDLRAAAARVARALELQPSEREALALRDEVARLRVGRLSRRPARVAAAAEPSAEAAESESFRPFTPPAEAGESLAVVESDGDLRIDFYSLRPRGVLTVYAGPTQILNRPFRFFEKRNMLRRRGIAGGFDERAKIPGGDVELRIYLTLPDRETELQTVAGTLPAGSLRTLRVRVDAGGQMRTELH